MAAARRVFGEQNIAGIDCEALARAGLDPSAPLRVMTNCRVGASCQANAPPV
jgi:hypothetical protein